MCAPFDPTGPRGFDVFAALPQPPEIRLDVPVSVASRLAGHDGHEMSYKLMKTEQGLKLIGARCLTCGVELL